MPYINGPSATYFYDQLKMIQRQLREIATQQNWSIRDGNLKLRIRAGLQPDQTFGIWMTDPTTGNPVMKLTGTALELLTSAGAKLIDLTDAGLALYDSAGHLLVDMTDTGMTVYNASGTEEVQLGALPGGGYGLAVLDPATSEMAHVSAPQESYVGTELSTASTSYTTLGGPTVTVTVGPAGRALVMPSSVIGIDGGATTSAKQGFVGVEVDGGAIYGLLSASSSPDSAGYVPGIQITSSNSRMLTGLSTGSHTFKCVYESAFGQTVHFSANSLVVIGY